jgi:hypothetical protein
VNVLVPASLCRRPGLRCYACRCRSEDVQIDNAEVRLRLGDDPIAGTRTARCAAPPATGAHERPVVVPRRETGHAHRTRAHRSPNFRRRPRGCRLTRRSTRSPTRVRRGPFGTPPRPDATSCQLPVLRSPQSAPVAGGQPRRRRSSRWFSQGFSRGVLPIVPWRARETRKPRACGAFDHAPKRTRTSTRESPDKALNLARLPIPPPAQVVRADRVAAAGGGRV